MSIISEFINKLFFNKKPIMESEIHIQPKVISELIGKYVSKSGEIRIDIPEKVTNIALIASGSSYHCATIIANFLREYVHCNAQSYYASEVSLQEDFDVDSNTLYIFISQSGETSDTNNAMTIISSKTDEIMAITNTKNSTLYNDAKYKVLTYAGVEKSIASTKAMSAQIFCLMLISVKIMMQKGLDHIKILNELTKVPEYINYVLKKSEMVYKYSYSLIKYDNAAILASGMFYPLAKEGALKIKETSYINTTAYPTGEFLHGHIAILNKKCAVITLVNNHNIRFTIDVIKKINETYNSDILIIAAMEILETGLNNVISVPSDSDISFLFSALTIFQLLAYKSASLLNRDVDNPNGLKKIVK